jgi:three-Cys-motif partner protein
MLISAIWVWQFHPAQDYRSRWMPTDQFFHERREWSDRKLALLQNYLGKPFTEILGSRPGGVFCVDGFAGRGEYEDGYVGSSLMSAQLAANFRKRGRFQLRCVNVEMMPNHFANLDQVTQRVAPGLVSNLPGSFKSQLPRTMEIVGAQPTLFFLDPFGVRGIEWDTLRPILERPSTTELLVRLHTPFLHRLSGFLGSNARSREGNIALLTQTIGSNEWMEYGIESSDEAWFVDRVLSSYVGRLKRRFTYVGAYPVRTLESELLKYHMVFCTRHPRGAVIMSDIVYKAEERFLDQRRDLIMKRGIQLDFAGERLLPQEEAAVVREDKLSRLSLRILEVVAQREAGLTYFEAKTVLVEEFFGLVSDQYYRQAVRRLADSALLRYDSSLPIDDNTLLMA